MRIAYLILCHTDPKHIYRLVNKITQGAEHEAFVHVDGKCDITPFRKVMQGIKGVYLLDERTDVYWGGYSAIEATVTLMKTALATGDYDRFVLLQGLEYPILSNSQINSFFEEHMETEFIRAKNISVSHEIRHTHKYKFFYYLDRNHIRIVRYLHKFNSYLLRKNRAVPFKKNYVKNKDGEKMWIHWGTAQFALTRQAVEYIVQFHDENPKFNHYFKSMFAVDEAYFHTILYNSRFVKKTADGKAVDAYKLSDMINLTYFEYPDMTVNITVHKKKQDYQKIRKSGKLFFRKATSDSVELLDYIDQKHKEEIV